MITSADNAVNSPIPMIMNWTAGLAKR